MRVSTAFNRLLKIPGASVSAVSITDTDVEVELRLRARRLECPCGHTSSATYDRSTRRWRHLDLGTHRLWLVYEIRRIDCPHCGVRTEHVPWARPTARHTRDFEDTVLWLAARTDRTSVSTLMRCAWETVTAIINRTVDELLDTRRLDRLYRIGVDEICYRHPHKYLTVVGDHDTKTVVHIEPGRSTESLAAFYEQQHESDLDSIESVSMDGSKAYRVATEEHVPNARICFDPFHVMQWVNRALDRVFADASSANRRRIELSSGSWRKVRIALRTGAERLTDQRRALLDTLTDQDQQVGHAWRLKEQMRDLFRVVKPSRAKRHLRTWIDDAAHSGIPAFTMLAQQIDKHYDGIIAAVELGISNGLIEGINSKIRLINARGYGHHSARTLTSMIYLNLGGIDPKLPTQR
ncbi:ISL3 family transposase [Rhodococcus opacus]|uniref:ISL3 family transposase n=1 Tax=Rhodococcus opacus TaxID=37919 RepID=UPI000EA8D230|nr:ISL3 family transposase [Rhodococcus opacus]QZS54691.1 ISL3 family transposase [Rhodococcus opacus]QZS56859.1 ISL3 family transposase [Rhodococcus opacus]QZS56993.1 ISL3 family transposase [Rhodococcus opacus]QZS58035.1 ISL3 family transposase [Rhodococcus opacus]QZS58635.1 ISL3 family transposase [Rhodococcus opacus]